MPQINISGQPPGGGGPASGPASASDLARSLAALARRAEAAAKSIEKLGDAAKVRTGAALGAAATNQLSSTLKDFTHLRRLRERTSAIEHKEGNERLQNALRSGRTVGRLQKQREALDHKEGNERFQNALRSGRITGRLQRQREAEESRDGNARLQNAMRSGRVLGNLQKRRETEEKKELQAQTRIFRENMKGVGLLAALRAKEASRVRKEDQNTIRARDRAAAVESKEGAERLRNANRSAVTMARLERRREVEEKKEVQARTSIFKESAKSAVLTAALRNKERVRARKEAADEISGARQNANAENSNLGYAASGGRLNARAENANRDYIASGERMNARAENANRDQIARTVKRLDDENFKKTYALAVRDNEAFDRRAGQRRFAQNFTPRGMRELSSNLMNNTIIGTAIEGTMIATMGDTMIASVMSKMFNIARQSVDYDLTTKAIGRSGSFNSGDLRNLLHPGSVPEWMKQYGYTEASAASDINNFGMSFRSPEAAVGMLKSVGAASQMTGMGLSKEALMGGLQSAATLGIVNPNNKDSMDDYFRRMQKVQITAGIYSLDHAQTQQQILGLVRQSAGSGGTGLSLGQAQSAWDRGVSSGSIGGRTGDLQSSILAGFNAQSGRGGPNGNMAFNMGIKRLTAKFGGTPKTLLGLKKFYDSVSGEGAFDQKQQQAGFRTIVDEYLAFAKDGNELMMWQRIGDLARDNPDMMRAIGNANTSLFPAGFGSNAFAGTTGISRQQAQQDHAHPASVPTMIGAPGSNVNEPIRGIRDNNPLNLTYSAGQPVIGKEGPFGVYGSMEAGVAQSYRQLLIYQDKDNLKTVRQIANKWANNPNESYITQVAKAMNVGPDDPIDLHNPETAQKLITAMSTQETKTLSPGVVSAGIAMGGRPYKEGDNNPYQENSMFSNLGHMIMVGEQQARSWVGKALTGQGGNAITQSMDSIKNATDRFITGVSDAAAALENLVDRISHLLPSISVSTTPVWSKPPVPAWANPNIKPNIMGAYDQPGTGSKVQ